MKNSALMATFLTCLCVTADAHALDYIEDAEGRSLRVNFPMHDRFWVSGGVPDAFDATPQFAMEYTEKYDLDFPNEEIWWQLRGGFLGAELSTDGNGKAGLARGEYLRHDKSSFIVVPAEVDWRVPAPFDLAVDWHLLSVSFANLEPSSIEPIAMGLSVDFCRDETFRSRCALGVNAAYTYDFNIQQHVITSFSTGSVRLQHQTEDGRFGASVQGDAGWKLLTSATERNWERGWAVVASAEWVFMAINDHPLSLVARGEHDQWAQASKVGAALRVSLPVR